MKSNEVRWTGNGDDYSCKYFTIRKTIVSMEKREFIIKFNNSYGEISLNEIGISDFRYQNFLLPKIKSRIKREHEKFNKQSIENYWDSFLEKNKDVNRDNKIDKILK